MLVLGLDLALRPINCGLGLGLGLGASTWFGPWSHKRKGQNDKMYSKFSLLC